MRCKKHPLDLSSIDGICASCLRERLDTYIAAQSQSESSPQFESCATIAFDDCPPSLIFPQSASAHTSHGKSTKPRWQGQNGRGRPSHYGKHGGAAGSDGNAAPNRKKWGKIWAFSNFFRFKSDKLESDHTRDPCEPSPSENSPSWYSMIFPSSWKIPVGRNEQKNVEEQRIGQQDCGKSQTKSDNFSEDCNDDDSECSPRWRKIATVAAPLAPRSRPGIGKSLSGIALCLNPMVMEGPVWRRTSKSSPSSKLTIAGESKATIKPNRSFALSFYSNRSIKIADFGKTSNNR